jgi:hypothetical protein
MPTSLTSIDSGSTAEIQAATSQVIAVRRIILPKTATVEVKADGTDILPPLQTTQTIIDLRFEPDAHAPTVPAGQALKIKNAGVTPAKVWVHWELQ